jgi:hypothetical protein
VKRIMDRQTDSYQNGDSHRESHRESHCGDAKHHSDKISDEFADRLASLPPDQPVRAVVLPAPYLVNGSNGARVHGEERQAIIREARTRTEEAFAEIDRVLAEVGGRRLTQWGNALGFIIVETYAKGIDAIADLGWVGSVFEDQAIRPVHQIESHPAH